MIMPLIDDKLGLTGRLSFAIGTDGRTIYLSWSPFSPDKAIRIRILAGILMKMCSINDEKVSEMYIRLVFKLMLTWWCCSSTKSWLLIGQPIRDVILKTIYSLLHSPELEFPDRVLVSIVSVIFDLPIDNLVCESQGSTRSFFCWGWFLAGRSNDPWYSLLRKYFIEPVDYLLELMKCISDRGTDLMHSVAAEYLNSGTCEERSGACTIIGQLNQAKLKGFYIRRQVALLSS